MAKFRVDVIETNCGFTEIEAESTEEAYAKVDDEYHKGNIQWTSSEFITQNVSK